VEVRCRPLAYARGSDSLIDDPRCFSIRLALW
jgi:hypothetical protein